MTDWKENAAVVREGIVSTGFPDSTKIDAALLALNSLIALLEEKERPFQFTKVFGSHAEMMEWLDWYAKSEQAQPYPKEYME